MSREKAFTAGDLEHLAAIALGATLAGVGLTRKTTAGYIMAGVGGAFMVRGLQGYKRLYDLLHVPFNEKPTVLPVRAVTVRDWIKVNRNPSDLYAFWRDLSNISQVMPNVISVNAIDEVRSHWVAKAPAGLVVEWDAEIINDEPGNLIAWRSLEGSDVDTAGSVHFDEQEDGSTIVWLTLRYLPPGDLLGATVAKLFGVDPATQLREDLERFKALMESGRQVTST